MEKTIVYLFWALIISLIVNEIGHELATFIHERRNRKAFKRFVQSMNNPGGACGR
jgi:hypothetical protein